LADSETITKLGGSFCDRFADPMLGGLSIKTSENKEYNLGCSSLGSNSFNLEVGNDIIFHGNHGDLIDGVGVYSSKFVKKLNKEKNISKSKLLFDKRKNINPNFTKELTQQ
jgi:hypothetical protein